MILTVGVEHCSSGIGQLVQVNLDLKSIERFLNLIGLFKLLEHLLETMLQHFRALSVLSTQYTVTVARFGLDLYSVLVALFFKILGIAVSPECSKCAVKRRSPVYLDISCQELKDMRVQFYHCRRLWQPM